MIASTKAGGSAVLPGDRHRQGEGGGKGQGGDGMDGMDEAEPDVPAPQ